jgi:hypothetical protein
MNRDCGHSSLLEIGGLAQPLFAILCPRAPSPCPFEKTLLRHRTSTLTSLLQL